MLILIFLALFNLKAQEPYNILLPDKFMVQDAIYFKDTSGVNKPKIKYPYIYSIEEKSPLVEILLANIATGNLRFTKWENINTPLFPYSLLNTKKFISLPEIARGLSKKDQEYEFKNKKEVNAIIADTLQKQSIGLIFYENWSFNPAKRSFEKEVVGYDIIRKYRIYGQDAFNMSFITLNPEQKVNSSKNRKLVCHAEYEYLLAPDIYYYNLVNQKSEDWDPPIKENSSDYFDFPAKSYESGMAHNAPYLIGYSKKKLIQSLITMELDEEVPAFDYFTDKELTKDEVISRLPGPKEYTTTDYEEEYIQSLPLEEYNSLIFIEDWFINSSNGFFEKRVNEIALAKSYMYWETFEGPPDYKKEVVFKIKLN